MTYNVGGLSDYSNGGISNNYGNNFGVSGMGRPPKPPSAEEKLARMTSDLNLTTEQQTKIKAILTQGLSPDQEATQVKALLTSSQKTTFEAKLSQMPQMGQNPTNNVGGPGQPPSIEERVARMTKELGLSTEQATKLKTILESYDTKMQQAQAQSFSAHEQIMTAMNEEIEGILTTDTQKQAFEAKIQEMEAKRKDTFQTSNNNFDASSFSSMLSTLLQNNNWN